MLQKSKVTTGKLTISDMDVSGQVAEARGPYPQKSSSNLLQTMAKSHRSISAASIKAWGLKESSEALQCIPASLREKHFQKTRQVTLSLLEARAENNKKQNPDNNNFENNNFETNNFENNNFENNNHANNNFENNHPENDNFENNNFENNNFENNNFGNNHHE